MLVALLTLVFFGGGSDSVVLAYIGDSRDAVKEAVEDETRRKSAIAALKDMQAHTKRHTKSTNKIVKNLKASLTDGDAQESDIEEFWVSYFAEKQAADQAMLDFRFSLRDQLTRDEWNKVFGATAD